jgi:phosphate-selective porin OprO/OprP
MNIRLVVCALLAGALALSGRAEQTNIEQRLDELEQEIRILKRQRELDQEATEQKSKETPVISAGKEGFALKSPDGNVVLRLKGQLQVDSRWYLEDDAQNGTDTFLIRRARPTLEGTFYKDFDFRLMPDFGNDSVALFDAYIEWKHWPWLKLRTGKFKPPVGLEQLQEDPYTEFAERALPTDLVPNRDIGVQLGGDLWEGVVQYQAGVFNGVADGVNGGFDNNDSKGFEGRVFLEPFKKTDIKPLQGLGLGIAGTIGHENGLPTNPNLPSFKTTGQLTFFKYLQPSTAATVTNTALASGQHTRWTPQAYYYWGPFGLLGEYVVSDQRVEIRPGGVTTRDYIRNSAWQAFGSVVLTGERASFRGVTPRKPFDLKNGGWGALELVGRYSVLHVDPDAFPTFANPDNSAQEAREWGVGLNWYLNTNVRLYANYEETAFDGGAAGGKNREKERVVFTRAQVKF